MFVDIRSNAVKITSVKSFIVPADGQLRLEKGQQNKEWRRKWPNLGRLATTIESETTKTKIIKMSIFSVFFLSRLDRWIDWIDWIDGLIGLTGSMD